MPYKFSKRSLSNLGECHLKLQIIFNTIIKYFDCTILDGHRGEKEQNEAFHKGTSKLKFPKSKHNKLPSLAVDVTPYPIPKKWGNIDTDKLMSIKNKKEFTKEIHFQFKERARFYYLKGLEMGTAQMLKIPIRQGCDWNGNFDFNDQNFDDLPHTELK